MTSYELSVADAAGHLLEIEVAASGLNGSAELVFPVWTPGSYLVREHARHVQWLRAVTGSAEKRAKDRWLVTPDRGELRVRYALYANELTVRTNHVDDTHAFVNPAAALPYIAGRREEKCRVTVRAPAGWTSVCALPTDDGAFVAADYDELADSPIHVAPKAEPLRFSVRGVPHELVVWGDPGPGYDPARLTADLAKIVEAQAAIFGGLPYERYVFLLMLDERGRGGLEHRASSALLAPRTTFRPAKSYEDLLLLAAHEAFHLWNVKRLKPRAFAPYDYSSENYTRLLWAMEGLTSFYEVATVRRAGLITGSRALEIWGERLTQLLRTPGRRVQSLEDASLDAWIKYYRSDEQSPAVQISYYLKGSIVGFLLDLELRARSGGRRSLDDVMRLLWAENGVAGVPLDEDAFERAASKVLGEDLSAWFARAVRSTEELDAAGALARAGLKLRLRPQETVRDRGGKPAPGGASEDDEQDRDRSWFGAEVKAEGGSLRIAAVLPASPASTAGLSAGDELVAIDGYKAEPRSWEERLLSRAPGTPARLHLFRRGRLVEASPVLASPPLDTAWIERDAAAAPELKALASAALAET